MWPISICLGLKAFDAVNAIETLKFSDLTESQKYFSSKNIGGTDYSMPLE
jgi:hypothetical protein